VGGLVAGFGGAAAGLEGAAGGFVEPLVGAALLVAGDFLVSVGFDGADVG